MPYRNRFTNMLLVLVACLLILNLVVGRSQTSRAATPTEYKQLLLDAGEVEKTLNASARDGWELAQIYRVQRGFDLGLFGFEEIAA